MLLGRGMHKHSGGSSQVTALGIHQKKIEKIFGIFYLQEVQRRGLNDR